MCHKKIVIVLQLLFRYPFETFLQLKCLVVKLKQNHNQFETKKVITNL